VATGMPLVCPGVPQWALEGSGGALLGSGGPWRALVFPVGLWWALVGAVVGSGRPWRGLVGPDGPWMGTGDLWWALVGPGEPWWALVGPGGPR
jgi:hypothetical protein